MDNQLAIVLLLRGLKIDLGDSFDYAATNDRTAIRSQIVAMEMKLQQIRELTELDALESLTPSDFVPILVPEPESCFLGADPKENVMTKNQKLKAELLAKGEARRLAGLAEQQDFADEDRKRLRIVPLDAGTSNPLYGQ